MDRADGTTDEAAGADQAGVATETILKATATKSPIPATEVLGGAAGDVAAETVSLERAGAERITAQRAILTQSGARLVQAKSAQLNQSGTLVLRAQQAVLHGSTAGAIAAKEVRLVRSRATILAAEQATVEPGARIFLHVGRAEGERPVVGTAGAAAFGGALGAVLVLLGLLLGRRRQGTGDRGRG